MDCKDFEVRVKGDWHYIGFWCKPESDDDAQKLAAVLRRILDNLAADVNDMAVNLNVPDEASAGIAN